jgi:hypothetical protein
VSELPPASEPGPFPPAPESALAPQLPPASLAQARGPLHGSSLALAILCGLGLVLAGLLAAGLLLFGLVGMGRGRAGAANAVTFFSIGWVSLLVALLQLPPLLLSIRRLAGKNIQTAPARRSWLIATLALVLMIPLVALGQLLADSENNVSLLFLPPLQLLVIGLPIWWALETGRHGLAGGSAQRGWGVVSFGTLITMPVVLVVELATMAVLGVLLLSFLSSQPGVLQELQNLLHTLSTSGFDTDAVTQLLEPYLRQPVFIFLVVVAGSAIMPLLEEALKPLALWFLSGRKMTLSQGFSAGLISGAVFALLESLFSLSPAMGPDWAGVVVGRMGTGLLHVTCSGLVGLGLALAWRREGYFQLGGLYLLAVTLHGSWNAVSLLTGFSALLDTAQPGPAAWLAQNGNFVLGGLVLVDLAVLLLVNAYLRRHAGDDEAPGAPLPTPRVYDPYASVPPIT